MRNFHSVLNTFKTGKFEIHYPKRFTRFMKLMAALPYSLWMAQRVLDCLHALPADQQTGVDRWVREQGGARLLDLQLPRLQRVGLRVAVES